MKPKNITLKELTGFIGSTTKIEVLNDGKVKTKTASDWYQSKNELTEKNIVSFQVNTQKYNTITVNLG